MKKIILSFLAIAALASCSDDENTGDLPPPVAKTDYFAVANRASGTVVIYNADTQVVAETITLEGDNASPTYVAYSKKRDLLYVADFANEEVSLYNAATFAKTGTFSTQMGSFHMWLNDTTDQLWVNNISAKTTSVLNLNDGSSLATLALPMGITLTEDAAQHDVIISPDGRFAYVSIFSQTGTNYVLQYNAASFELMNSVTVGGDPHLIVTDRFLYILSQDDSTISEYNFSDLSPTENIGSLMNVHGVTNGTENELFLTNISDRKVAQYNPMTQTSSFITDAGSTEGVAHNVAYNPDASVLALTLSGSNTVDFFTITPTGITFLSTVTSGDNPFGIVYMDR